MMNDQQLLVALDAIWRECAQSPLRSSAEDKAARKLRERFGIPTDLAYELLNGPSPMRAMRAARPITAVIELAKKPKPTNRKEL